jgi:O-antigen ligase
VKSAETHQRPVFIALAAGLILSPVGFGGTTSWFTSAFVIYTACMALFWAMTATVESTHPAVNRRHIFLPVMLASLAIAWCFAQAFMPVPPGIAHGVWSELSGLISMSERQLLTPAISANPQASADGALRLTGYCLVFLLSYQIAVAERRAARLLTVITLAGTAYALYGIALELSGSGFVLWYERDFEPGNLSSTFPNRNAFADYATLCLLSGCTLIYRATIRQEDLSRGWLQATTAVSVFYLRRNGWAIYAVVILFNAILMTHSRGGLVVAIIALGIFAGCAMRNALNRKFALIGIVILATGAALLVGMAGRGTIERFARIDTASLERVEIFRLTIEAIRDRPLLGTGLGTFSDIFAAYRTKSLLPQIDFAHNSFLENALEMGIPAAIAFYAGLMALFIFFVRSLRHSRNRHPYPVLGVSAMAMAFLHSLFDYADQFPAVAITFAAILGIAAAQSSCIASARTAYTGTDRRQT